MTDPDPDEVPTVEDLPGSRVRGRGSSLAIRRAMPRALGALTLACVLLGGRMPLAAQQPGPAREMLLFREIPTVISATGREQPLSQAPVAVTVITAEQIRQSGATTLPDLLRIVSGLDVAQATASNAHIAARGLNKSGTQVMQVLIDGRPASENFIATTLWYQFPLSLEEIERIEVVKSPSAALYGDRAFGGLVHIITKRPEAIPGTHLAITGGEAGTAIATVLHAGVQGRLTYKVTAGYDRTDQFPNPRQGISDDDLGRENFFGSLRLGYRLAGGAELSLYTGFTHFKRLDIIAEPGPRNQGRGDFGYVQAVYRDGGFLAQYSLNAADAWAPPPVDTTIRFFAHQLDVQHSTAWGPHILTAGVSGRYNTVDANFIEGGRQDQFLFGVFLQDEYRLRDGLTATLGARLDTHPDAGVRVSPRASLVYTPWPDQTFRASVGLAYRYPSVIENFHSQSIATFAPPPAPSTVQLVGNPDVDPARLVSYELGYRGRLHDRARLTVDLFYSPFDDSIELRPDPANPAQLTYANADAYSTVGGELGLEVLLAEWLLGFANYSYQYRYIDDPTVPGVVPRHKANAGLTLSRWGFTGTLWLHYVGKEEGALGKLDSYTLVNARLARPFKLFGQDAEFAVQAFNLFNDVHQETVGGDRIDRRISATLRVQF
jgi:iron complex outermembrane receptor protein